MLFVSARIKDQEHYKHLVISIMKRGEDDGTEGGFQ